MIVSIDGNDVGKHLEKWILQEDLYQLKLYSEKITASVRTMEEAIINLGGKCFLVGGDNILSEISNDKMDELIAIIQSCQETDLTFSVGIGESITDAYLALKYVKAIRSGYICKKSGEDYVIEDFAKKLH